MICTNRFVCVELGGVRFGGVYSKCGSRVHELSRWLDMIRGYVSGARWILIGDWNAHHESWSLDGRSDSVGRVLKEWRQLQGARLLRGREHTFERRRGGGVVVSRIDFALVGAGLSVGASQLGGVYRIIQRSGAWSRSTTWWMWWDTVTLWIG